MCLMDFTIPSLLGLMNFTATQLFKVRDVNHRFHYTTVTFKFRVCLIHFTVPSSLEVRDCLMYFAVPSLLQGRDFLSVSLHCSSVTLGQGHSVCMFSIRCTVTFFRTGTLLFHYPTSQGVPTYFNLFLILFNSHQTFNVEPLLWFSLRNVTMTFYFCL